MNLSNFLLKSQGLKSLWLFSSFSQRICEVHLICKEWNGKVLQKDNPLFLKMAAQQISKQVNLGCCITGRCGHP